MCRLLFFFKQLYCLFLAGQRGVERRARKKKKLTGEPGGPWGPGKPGGPCGQKDSQRSTSEHPRQDNSPFPWQLKPHCRQCVYVCVSVWTLKMNISLGPAGCTGRQWRSPQIILKLNQLINWHRSYNSFVLKPLIIIMPLITIVNVPLLHFLRFGHRRNPCLLKSAKINVCLLSLTPSEVSICSFISKKKLHEQKMEYWINFQATIQKVSSKHSQCFLVFQHGLCPQGHPGVKARKERLDCDLRFKINSSSGSPCKSVANPVYTPVPLAVLEIQAIQALQESLRSSDSPREAKTETPGGAFTSFAYGRAQKR